jgi:hypothetical protein
MIDPHDKERLRLAVRGMHDALGMWPGRLREERLIDAYRELVWTAFTVCQPEEEDSPVRWVDGEAP